MGIPSLNPRRLATGLLFLFIVLFVVARTMEPRCPALGWLRAFSEAAMIGACADWFAVVALFRHPMGLPIPHTAIIPKGKTKIGKMLGIFVAENFLTPEVIKPHLEKADIAGVAAQFLQKNADLLSSQASRMLPGILEVLVDHRCTDFVFDQACLVLARVPAAPVLGEFLDLATRNGAHEPLLTHAFQLAGGLVSNNRDRIRAEIAAEVPLPNLGPLNLKGMVADYIADKTVSRICTILNEAMANEQSGLRQQFRKWLQEEIDKLKKSPSYLAKGEAIKHGLLENPAIRQYASHLLGEIQTALIKSVKADNSQIKAGFHKLFFQTCAYLNSDVELRNDLNSLIRAWALDELNGFGKGVGELIAKTIDTWEADHLVGKLEDAVGNDLQFIRINGTLIGGLIGLILHAIEKVVWP